MRYEGTSTELEVEASRCILQSKFVFLCMQCGKAGDGNPSSEHHAQFFYSGIRRQIAICSSSAFAGK